MQMRLCRVAGIADTANDFANGNHFALRNHDAIFLHVRQHNVCAGAGDRDHISGGVLAIPLWRREIGQAVAHINNAPIAGAHDRRAIDCVTLQFFRRQTTIGMKARGIESNNIGRIALRLVVGMMIEQRDASALAYDEAPVAQREREVASAGGRQRAEKI